VGFLGCAFWTWEQMVFGHLDWAVPPLPCRLQREGPTAIMARRTPLELGKENEPLTNHLSGKRSVKLFCFGIKVSEPLVAESLCCEYKICLKLIETWEQAKRFQAGTEYLWKSGIEIWGQIKRFQADYSTELNETWQRVKRFQVDFNLELIEIGQPDQEISSR